MSKVDEFTANLGDARRRKIVNKRKVVRVPKPIPFVPGQMRLSPVRGVPSVSRRDELYERNKRLADESAREDMIAHERRMRK